MVNGLMLALSVAVALPSYSKSVEYRGPVGGAFGQGSNWSDGRTPTKGDVAILPVGCHAVVGLTDLPVLTNLSEIVLQGKTSVLEVRDAAVVFPPGAARFSGSGEFRASATGDRQPKICLRQDNSAFAGSFVFTNVHPVVCGPRALGRNCPVTFFKTRADGNDAFTFAQDGEYASDIELRHPKGSLWYAFSAEGASVRVVNRGRVRVGPLPGASCIRFHAPPGVVFVQRGGIETSSRIDVNGNVLLDGPLDFRGTGEVLFSDGAERCLRIGPGFSFNGARGAAANVEALLATGRLGQHEKFLVETDGVEGVRAGTYPADILHHYLRGGGRETLARAEKGPRGEAVLRFSPQTPVRTIRDQVRSALLFGDARTTVVSLAEGVYPVSETVELDLRDSGTAAHPVIWRGEGKGAVFSAGVELTGWRPDPDQSGVWRAPAPRDEAGRPLWADCLFVDGVRQQVAAFPVAGGFFHATNITEKIFAAEGSYKPWNYDIPAEHTFFLTDADFAHVADLPATDLPFLRLRIHSKWNSSRHIVTRIDCRTKSVTVGGLRWPPWNRYKADECLIRIENLRSAFGRPDEWFYDARRAEIAYRPPSGADVRRQRIIVPRDGLETLFRMTGDIPACAWAGNLRFENLGFSYAAPMGERGPADVPDNLLLGGFAQAMVVADGVRGVVFDRCRWEHTGSYCVWFREGCMSNSVVNSVFTDLGGGAVRVGQKGGRSAVKGLSQVAPTGAVAYACYVPHSTAFIRIENNLIEHAGRFLPGAGGIVVGAASDCRIIHNRIDDLHYSAITCGWDFGYGGSPAQRNLIAFNHISNVGTGDLSDMAGVYLLGTSFGTVVSDNVIHGVKGMVYGGWGIYPDEGTEGVVCRNNLVYDTKDGAVHQHYGRNNVFENNIFGFSHEGQLAVTRAEPWRSYSMTGNIIVWDGGEAFEKYFGTTSEKAKIDWRRNLWWRLDGNDRVFNGKSFADWQAKGNDADGAFADPKFVDVAARDFRLKPDSPAFKLGFKPFDFTRAGLRKPKAKAKGER